MNQSDHASQDMSPVPQSDGVSRFVGGNEIPENFRCGYVAIIGTPNVGKSTLLNALLNQKISIVTPKPQTTRHKVVGLLSTTTYQIVFLDTPGIINPAYVLQEVMMESANSAINDADLVLLMIDAINPNVDSVGTQGGILARVRHVKVPVVLIINKVDLVRKADILPIIDFYSKAFAFREIVPLSALTGDGTGELLKIVVGYLPLHPPFYPLDIVSEQSERFFVGEILREKVFLLCQEEVPYSTTVDVVDFKEGDRKKAFISIDIIVERESQRGIIIGKKGIMLKKIGSIARKEIEEFLQRPVFLDLRVKVREKWRRDKAWLQRRGYGV